MKKINIYRERNHRVTKEVMGGNSRERTIILHKLSPQIESIKLRKSYGYDKRLLVGQIELRDYDCDSTPVPPTEPPEWTGGADCCELGCPDCGTPSPSTPSPSTPSPSAPVPSPSPSPSPTPTPAPPIELIHTCCGCNDLGPLGCWEVDENETCESGAPGNVRVIVDHGMTVFGCNDFQSNPCGDICEDIPECCGIWEQPPAWKWTCCNGPTNYSAQDNDYENCPEHDNSSCYLAGTCGCVWNWVPWDPCQSFCDPNDPAPWYDHQVCLDEVEEAWGCDISGWHYSTCCTYGDFAPCDCFDSDGNGCDSRESCEELGCNVFGSWADCAVDASGLNSDEQNDVNSHPCSNCCNDHQGPWDDIDDDSNCTAEDYGHDDGTTDGGCGCPCGENQVCLPGVASCCECPVAVECCGDDGVCGECNSQCNCNEPCNESCLCCYTPFPGAGKVCGGRTIQYGGCDESCKSYWGLGDNTNPPCGYENEGTCICDLAYVHSCVPG